MLMMSACQHVIVPSRFEILLRPRTKPSHGGCAYFADSLELHQADVLGSVKDSAASACCASWEASALFEDCQADVGGTASLQGGSNLNDLGLCFERTWKAV